MYAFKYGHQIRVMPSACTVLLLHLLTKGQSREGLNASEMLVLMLNAKATVKLWSRNDSVQQLPS